MRPRALNRRKKVGQKAPCRRNGERCADQKPAEGIAVFGGPVDKVYGDETDPNQGGSWGS